MNRFGYPDLMRAGLGNMLYPWARCFVWCRAERAEMLAPRWFKFRVGPYVRRERDKRRYDRLFTSDGYIRGPRRGWVLARGDVLDEGDTGARPKDHMQVVRFAGLDGYFAPLHGRQAEIRTELIRITKPRLRPQMSTEPFAAVHVRCGDFTDEMRQPQEWYISAIDAVRREVGEIAVRLYSDGHPEELEPLLRTSGVRFVQGRASITDMLEMSNASVIVASSSTFSMWGSFLGDVPSVWYPGRMWQAPTANADNHIEWDGATALPGPFLKRLRAAPQP